MRDREQELTLGDVLKYEQPYKYAVEDVQFNEKSGTPVLTAGKSFILGFTSESSNTYEDLPVIIFDDFTTDCKYVDFPFKVKSSAMKFLKERHKGQTDLKYLFEILQTVKLQTTGGDHKRRWISEYSKIRIKLPKYPEQTRIAEILSTVDEAIAATEALIAKYSRIKTGLMQDLLTRGIDERGNIRSKATHRFVMKNGIEVPEEWEVGTIANIAYINPSTSLTGLEESDEVSFFRMEDVSNNAEIIFSGNRKLKEVNKGFTSFQEHDTLFAKITPCMENGKGALVNELTNSVGFGSTEFHVLRPKNEASKLFLYYYTTFKPFRQKAEATMTGSAGQQRVQRSFFENYLIGVPKPQEQYAIGERISSVRNFIRTEEVQKNKLALLKNGLMQDLLTGKVQVQTQTLETFS